MFSTWFVFFFLGRSEKQDGRHGLWLAETFSTSHLKPLNGIEQNLTGSKIWASFTKFVWVFFSADRKNKIADLASDWMRRVPETSETAERNSTKLDRK